MDGTAASFCKSKSVHMNESVMDLAFVSMTARQLANNM